MKKTSKSRKSDFVDPLDLKAQRKPDGRNRHAEKHMKQALKQKNISKLIELEDDY